MPDRFYEKFRSGPLKGVGHNRKQFKEALQTYYDMAGYDRKTGHPPLPSSTSWIWAGSWKRRGAGGGGRGLIYFGKQGTKRARAGLAPCT